MGANSPILTTGMPETDHVADGPTAAADLPPLPAATRTAIEDVYRRRIAPQVHQRW